MTPARLAAAGTVPPLDAVVPAWPGERRNLAGSSVFVRRTPTTAPDAAPALYLHGLGGSSLNWTDLAYLLAGRLSGEAVDLPGFGFSDPGSRYSVTALSDWLVRYLEDGGRGAVHLVGNSLGGVVCLRVAGTRPDLVRTLTLVSPAMPFLDPRRSVHGRLVPLLFVPGVARLASRRLAAVGPEDLARDVINSCFADPTRVGPQRFAEAVAEIRRRSEVPGFLTAYIGCLRGLVGAYVRAYLPGAGSLWRIARSITVPTLVVAGGLDRIVDPRVGPAVARAIPDSRLLVLDRVGHVAQMEEPQLVARAVVGLLDEVEPGQRRLADHGRRRAGDEGSPEDPATSRGVCHSDGRCPANRSEGRTGRFVPAP
jgi:pimeloyl-ACP methyl ester carboxylesterase